LRVGVSGIRVSFYREIGGGGGGKSKGTKKKSSIKGNCPMIYKKVGKVKGKAVKRTRRKMRERGVIGSWDKKRKGKEGPMGHMGFLYLSTTVEKSIEKETRCPLGAMAIGGGVGGKFQIH